MYFDWLINCFVKSLSFVCIISFLCDGDNDGDSLQFQSLQNRVSDIDLMCFLNGLSVFRKMLLVGFQELLHHFVHTKRSQRVCWTHHSLFLLTPEFVCRASLIKLNWPLTLYDFCTNCLWAYSMWHAVCSITTYDILLLWTEKVWLGCWACITSAELLPLGS